MELKVFTLPTCPTCPTAKTIALEVANKAGISFKEINMASKQGLEEALSYDICSAPSIMVDEEILARGMLMTKEKLEEEVSARLSSWRTRASSTDAAFK